MPGFPFAEMAVGSKRATIRPGCRREEFPWVFPAWKGGKSNNNGTFGGVNLP